MVDQIGKLSNTFITPETGNLSEQVISGDAEGALGPNSSLGPDATAMFQAMQKMQHDQEVFDLLRKAQELKHEAVKETIQSIR
jgi:hypothetical protein